MTAMQRLNEARKSAIKYAEAQHYNDWRHWIIRKNKHCRAAWPDDKNVGQYYVESLEALGWRHVGDSHDIIRLNHTGWYADNFQQGRYVGAVLRLPTRNGVKQYVPAIYHTDWDTATIYLNEITSDKKAAAGWADQNAEREAERSREADAQDHAEQQIAEARAEIHVINRQVLPALKELKGANLTPAICSMVRAGITELLGDRRTQFNTIKKLEDDFWQAVPQ